MMQCTSLSRGPETKGKRQSSSKDVKRNGMEKSETIAGRRVLFQKRSEMHAEALQQAKDAAKDAGWSKDATTDAAFTIWNPQMCVCFLFFSNNHNHNHNHNHNQNHNHILIHNQNRNHNHNPTTIAIAIAMAIAIAINITTIKFMIMIIIITAARSGVCSKLGLWLVGGSCESACQCSESTGHLLFFLRSHSACPWLAQHANSNL